MTYDVFPDAVEDRLSVDDRNGAADIETVVGATFSEILYRTEWDKLTAPQAAQAAVAAHRPESSRREIKRLNAAAFLDRVQARADLNQEETEIATRVVIVLCKAVAARYCRTLAGKFLPATPSSPSSCHNPTHRAPPRRGRRRAA
jgi:hypothetical protein